MFQNIFAYQWTTAIKLHLLRCRRGSLQATAADVGRAVAAEPAGLHAAGVPAVVPLQGAQEEREEQEAVAARPAGRQERGGRGLSTGNASLPVLQANLKKKKKKTIFEF